MISPKLIHVACCFDKNYLPHIATLIESIAASNPPGWIYLHLIHDDSVSQGLKDELSQQCSRHGFQFELLLIDKQSESRLPPSRGYPKVIWYRALLPELLAAIDSVIYMDGDTLVLQSLLGLSHMDIGDYLLAAVPSPRSESSNQRLRRLGISADTPFFNSGVLLMNLEKMRREKFTGKVIEIGHTRATEFKYPDQDTLNLSSEKNWLALHPKWNLLSSYLASQSQNAPELQSFNSLTIQEATASPAILHFEGSPFFKPWVSRSIHPHKQLYLAYRSRTQWPIVISNFEKWLSRFWKLVPYKIQVALTKLKRINVKVDDRRS